MHFGSPRHAVARQGEHFILVEQTVYGKQRFVNAYVSTVIIAILIYDIHWRSDDTHQSRSGGRCNSLYTSTSIRLPH